MTMKSLALAVAMMSALAPATAYAQTTTPSHLVAPPMATPRPEGHATDVTDRAGQTKKPSVVKHTPPPTNVPNWHIPLPHIHRGR